MSARAADALGRTRFLPPLDHAPGAQAGVDGRRQGIGCAAAGRADHERRRVRVHRGAGDGAARLRRQLEEEFGRNAARTRPQRMTRGIRWSAVLLGTLVMSRAAELKLVWPTPSTDWANGKS